MSFSNDCLYRQCLYNNIAGINFFINQQVDMNYGLYGACEGGNKDLVILMIKNGAGDWNRGLKSACRGGHKDLVSFMIEKGADDWNEGLYTACWEDIKI